METLKLLLDYFPTAVYTGKCLVFISEDWRVELTEHKDSDFSRGLHSLGHSRADLQGPLPGNSCRGSTRIFNCRRWGNWPSRLRNTCNWRSARICARTSIDWGPFFPRIESPCNVCGQSNYRFEPPSRKMRRRDVHGQDRPRQQPHCRGGRPRGDDQNPGGGPARKRPGQPVPGGVLAGLGVKKNAVGRLRADQPGQARPGGGDFRGAVSGRLGLGEGSS